MHFVDDYVKKNSFFFWKKKGNTWDQQEHLYQQEFILLQLESRKSKKAIT